jgi:ribonuclease VapC
MRVLLAGAQLKVHAVDPAFARLVADAYTAWGNGVHPAGLNNFDCFAYALAQEREAKLLFVGDCFPRTDITPALPPTR